MNRLEQALHCLQKVFALKTRLRALREQRPFARIDAPAVLVCLLLGVFTRGSSYLDLAQQTQRRRWRRLCGLKEAVGDDLFGQINGLQINALLDLEPIRPGEDECAAALRWLGRLRRMCGPRFFDAITADAWYAKGPFLRTAQKMGWPWVGVLKGEDLQVFQEARQLSQGRKPAALFEDAERKRRVQLWEVKDPEFGQEYGQAVRVVRSEEQWTETRQRGGRRRGQVRQSLWVRAASGKLDGYPAGMIYQGGHRRWGIENKAFNELTQSYHLDHCYHHEGASMLAQRLILLWGFLLFNAFAPLQSKLLALGKITTKALARQLNLALEEDRTWEQWCQSG